MRILGASALSRRRRLSSSSCLSVFPSTCVNSATTWRIFMKFYTRLLKQKYVRHLQICLKSDNSIGHFILKQKCQASTDLFKIGQQCRTLYSKTKICQASTDLFKIGQQCRTLYSKTKICQASTDLFKIGQLCRTLYSKTKICQASTDLFEIGLQCRTLYVKTHIGPYCWQQYEVFCNSTTMQSGSIQITQMKHPTRCNNQS